MPIRIGPAYNASRASKFTPSRAGNIGLRPVEQPHSVNARSGRQNWQRRKINAFKLTQTYSDIGDPLATVPDSLNQRKPMWSKHYAR